MIDVIIPAYNCTKTIRKTLFSLASQTDSNFYVTIVDDCSVDNLKAVIDEFDSILNIQYIRNNQNIGCGMSRQVGIDHIKSSHYCFLDSDDMFMPYTVQIFNRAIEKNPEIEFLYGQFYRQSLADGKLTIILEDEGFTWCHGKLYNAEKIKKFNIRNRADIKYADDSYWNSMCFELLKAQKIDIPLYLYIDNPESVTRCENSERDKMVMKDFMHAMIESSKNVLKYKTHINHLQNTLAFIRSKKIVDTEEKKLYQELIELSSINKNHLNEEDDCL